MHNIVRVVIVVCAVFLFPYANAVILLLICTRIDFYVICFNTRLNNSLHSLFNIHMVLRMCQESERGRQGEKVCFAAGIFTYFSGKTLKDDKFNLHAMQ